MLLICCIKIRYLVLKSRRHKPPTHDDRESNAINYRDIVHVSSTDRIDWRKGIHLGQVSTILTVMVVGGLTRRENTNQQNKTILQTRPKFPSQNGPCRSFDLPYDHKQSTGMQYERYRSTTHAVTMLLTER